MKSEIIRHLEKESFERLKRVFNLKPVTPPGIMRKPERQSWVDGPWCPGCRGTWPDLQTLAAHLPSCYTFNLTAMEEAEARIEKGFTVDDKLAARYERYQALGLGPVRELAGQVRSPNADERKLSNSKTIHSKERN